MKILSQNLITIEGVRKPRIALYLAALLGWTVLGAGCGPTGEERIREACRKLTVARSILLDKCTNLFEKSADDALSGNLDAVQLTNMDKCNELQSEINTKRITLDCNKYGE